MRAKRVERVIVWELDATVYKSPSGLEELERHSKTGDEVGIVEMRDDVVDHHLVRDE